MDFGEYYEAIIDLAEQYVVAHDVLMDFELANEIGETLLEFFEESEYDHLIDFCNNVIDSYSHG